MELNPKALSGVPLPFELNKTLCSSPFSSKNHSAPFFWFTCNLALTFPSLLFKLFPWLPPLDFISNAIPLERPSVLAFGTKNYKLRGENSLSFLEVTSPNLRCE